MGLLPSKEGNPFRDCILRGLQDSEIIAGDPTTKIRFSLKKMPQQDDLALVLRRFELPVDLSYAVKSMYNGYFYHTGILYGGKVYSYMPDTHYLLDAEMKDSINIDDLDYFKKQGPTEIYYITNKGQARAMIISRLINFMKIMNGEMTIPLFNQMYGLKLGEYYNIFINNCEHIVSTILTGKNFSCQEEMVDPDIRSYWQMIQRYKCSLPLFARVWINEYERIMMPTSQ